MMTSINGARWWKVALPLALFVPLVAGCGGQSPGVGTTAAPLRAETPAQWRQVNPPPGASKLASLAVSPVNGADAWDCESTDPYTYLIWATTDAGAHWRQAGTLAASHESNATPPVYCRLYTDQANPQVLAADFLYLSRPPDPTIPAGYDLSYLSQDGGATWRPMPGKTQIEALTTSGPSLYALVDDTSIAAFMLHLVVSADSLQTWQTLPLPAASANRASTSGKVNHLYGARGADGVIVSADGLPLEHLNASTGAWTPIHLPPLTTRENEGLQLPITWLPAQHTWMICIGALNFATIPPRTGLLRCTTDDGATARSRRMRRALPCRPPTVTGLVFRARSRMTAPSSPGVKRRLLTLHLMHRRYRLRSLDIFCAWRCPHRSGSTLAHWEGAISASARRGRWSGTPEITIPPG